MNKIVIPESQLLIITDFSSYVHHVFPIRFTDDVVLTSELIEVKEVDTYSPAGRIPFSLIFRTEQKNHYFIQSICILQHPVKGEVPVFLVPLGPDQQGMRYEAVFI